MKFKDALDREWSIVIHVTALRHVKDETDIDLCAVTESREKAGTLLDNPFKLAELLYVILEPQIKELGLSADQFAEGLAGDGLQRAIEALMQSLIDFFPNPRRQVLQAVWDTIRQTQEKVAATAIRRLQSPEGQAEIMKKIETLGAKFGESPESSESTQALSPSASSSG